MNDANETMSDLKVQNQSIAANKRRMEAELDNLKVRYIMSFLLLINGMDVCNRLDHQLGIVKSSS